MIPRRATSCGRCKKGLLGAGASVHHVRRLREVGPGMDIGVDMVEEWEIDGEVERMR